MYRRVSGSNRQVHGYQDYFVEVRKHAENAMAELQDKLTNVLVVPNVIKKIRSGMSV